jgi:hypothetical protein
MKAELKKCKMHTMKSPGTDVMIFKNIFAEKFSKKLAFFTQNKAKLCKILIITLVFEKNANFFAENCRKSQKIVIITSTPGIALKILLNLENELRTSRVNGIAVRQDEWFSRTPWSMVLWRRLSEQVRILPDCCCVLILTCRDGDNYLFYFKFYGRIAKNVFIIHMLNGVEG